jgi:hypothetical protein
MKQIITLVFFALCLSVNAEVELPDYYQIESVKEDTTLSKNNSRLTLIVYNKDTGMPHIGASIHLDINSLLGQTDSSGTVAASFNAGHHRICADTKEGNSFIHNHTFLAKMHYTVKVWMATYKILTIDPNYNIYPMADKPVIYLYPTKKQKINITVKPLNGFSFTYPEYTKDGWNITVQPNGNIICNDRSYNYLFWEGPLIDKAKFDLTTGFYVHSDTVVQFLEHTLAKVGLSDIEQADFITFWAPKLIQNDLNFIHFEFNDGYEKLISKMDITPNPETLIRVFMVFKPVMKALPLSNQSIPSYQRKGFTVIEWGGSQIQ